MADEHAPKRARQACRNCRRKKTRCGGEKPACSVCVRLGQSCEYASGSTPARSSIRNSLGGTLCLDEQPDLTARVSFLESQLGISRSKQALSPRSVASGGGSVETPRRDSTTQAGNIRGNSPFFVSPSGGSQHDTDKFTVVPPMPILQSLTDVYFTYCHNQPYSYFLEASFRMRLQDGTLPEHVLLAFTATAVRYSTHEFFEGRNPEAIETYARAAWNIVLRQVFSSEQGLDLYVVQSTNLLAIIDFTAGQHRLGWVKIGLAVRFAQGLRLNSEPDHSLPLWQQEEHRRVFWSVYLLDRFVSCSRARSATISDRDCTVRLPVSDEEFYSGSPVEAPTLSILRDFPDMEKCRNLCDFALTILMSSILARVIRYSLQHNAGNEFPPWDYRSDFTKLRSTLFCFERLFADDSLSTTIQNRFQVGDRFCKQQVAHYIWCRGLYYLCGCLLHHPFLLYNDLKHYRQIFPPSFARHSLEKCRGDAEQLTIVLNTVQKTHWCARGSFLGYFAVVASSLHRLYQYSTNQMLKSRAFDMYATCLEFLEQPPLHWQSYGMMATALRQFDVEEVMARKLIEPSVVDDEIEPEDIDALWRILDYGWLTDSNRTERPFKPNSSQAAAIFNWQFFEELVNSDFSIPLNQTSERVKDNHAHNNKPDQNRYWWNQLGNGM